MFSLIKKFFVKETVDFSSIYKRGGIIVDVRSVAEFKSGHLKGAVNIPLGELAKEMKKYDKSSVIITCCASGIRSLSGQNIIKSLGFKEVYNGGSWTSLKSKIG